MGDVNEGKSLSDQTPTSTAIGFSCRVANWSASCQLNSLHLSVHLDNPFHWLCLLRGVVNATFSHVINSQKLPGTCLKPKYNFPTNLGYHYGLHISMFRDTNVVTFMSRANRG